MRRIVLIFILNCFMWPCQAFADSSGYADQGGGDNRGYANNHVPPYTRDGGPNLIYHWIEGGGARLYWNSVAYPKQVRLMGARFKDPADVPILTMKEQPKRTVKRRYRARNTRRKCTPRRKTTVALKPMATKPNVSPKLGPVTPKPSPSNTETPKPVTPKPVPMQAADPVGHVPPERLQ